MVPLKKKKESTSIIYLVVLKIKQYYKIKIKQTKVPFCLFYLSLSFSVALLVSSLGQGWIKIEIHDLLTPHPFVQAYVKLVI